MKKIKILYAVSILIAIFNFLGYIFFYTTPEIYNAHKSVEDELTFGSYNLYINVVQSIAIFIGIFLSIKCLHTIIRSGFFTQASKKFMQQAGYVFFISGLIMIILDIIRLIDSDGSIAVMWIVLFDFIFTLFGFVVLIVADMAQTGYQLKSENDLTI